MKKENGIYALLDALASESALDDPIRTTGDIINQEMINDLKINLNVTEDVLDFVALY